MIIQQLFYVHMKACVSSIYIKYIDIVQHFTTIGQKREIHVQSILPSMKKNTKFYVQPIKRVIYSHN